MDDLASVICVLCAGVWADEQRAWPFCGDSRDGRHVLESVEASDD